MKLLLRRSQRLALLGKVIFSLTVRAELTDDERAHVRRYKLGSAVLYENKEMRQGGNGYQQLGNLLMHNLLALIITVDDLARGKTIECKDILEMLAAQEQVREAARNLKGILQAAATFEGEEVIEI